MDIGNEPPVGLTRLRVEESHIHISGGNFYDIQGDVHMHCAYLSEAIVAFFHDYTDTGGGKEKVARWLSETDYRSIQSNLSNKRTPETGQWFLETAVFKEKFSESSDGCVLWCTGIPGVGKTMLASLAIDHLLKQTSGDTALAFVYFNHKERVQQGIDTVVRAIARQVYEISGQHANSAAYSEFESIYKGHQDGGYSPSLSDLLEALKACLAHFENVFIVIDALDEYLLEHSDKKIRLLLDTILSLHGRIKLLVTSRLIAGFDTIFDEFGASHMQIEALADDIRSYIEARLDDQAFDFELTPDLRLEIIETVIQVAGGRFLMIALCMNDLLEDKTSIGDIEDALELLPTEVGDAYCRCMSRIQELNPKMRTLARRAVMLAAYTNRELTIQEFQHALATDPSRRTKDIQKYIVPLSAITASCAGLLAIQESKIVFIHYTVQEYFDKEGHVHFPDAQAEITNLCLDYLTLGALSEELAYEYSAKIMERLPFYEYAALNWGKHAPASDQLLAERITTWLGGADISVQHQANYLIHQETRSDGEVVRSGASLFVAVFHNHIPSIKLLLANVSVIPTTSKQKTPFVLVTAPHQTEAAERLIEKFGPNLRVGYQRSPLDHASIYGLTDVAKHLLQRLADDKAADLTSHVKSALEQTFDVCSRFVWNDSVSARYIEILGLLLNALNNGRGYLNHALHMALEAGRCNAAEFLLQHGADPISVSRHDETPLMIACRVSRADLVNLLLKHEAVRQNLNMTTKRGTALISAAQAVQSAIMTQILIENGALVSVVDEASGWTPLCYAAAWGDLPAVQLLLPHTDSSTLNHRTNDGRTALSLAAAQANAYLDYRCETTAADVVKHLLSREDININSVDDRGNTAADYACLAGYRASVLPILQEHGAEHGKHLSSSQKDPAGHLMEALKRRLDEEVKRILQEGGITEEPRNEGGLTPLMIAAATDQSEMVTLLCGQTWVNLNATDNNGRSALAHAARTMEEDCLWELLRQDGIDVNQRDKDGVSPLGHVLHAPMTGKEKALDLLCHKDIDLFSCDKLERHALSHSICSSSNVRFFIVEELVTWPAPADELVKDYPKLDIGINWKDVEGRSALSLACGWADTTCVQAVLRCKPIDVNIQDLHSRTPLSWAVCGVKEDMISESLQRAVTLQATEEKSIFRRLLDAANWASSNARERASGVKSIQPEHAVKEVVDILLERVELDLNLPDKNGKTPLWYAERLGYERVAGVLRSKGATL